MLGPNNPEVYSSIHFRLVWQNVKANNKNNVNMKRRTYIYIMNYSGRLIAKYCVIEGMHIAQW